MSEVNEFSAIKEVNTQQESRSTQLRNSVVIDVHGKNIHSVLDNKIEGMSLGDVISMKDGRSFVLCKNDNAAAIAPGESVTLAPTIYDIDGTNEVIIATRSREFIEFYLGASGTVTTRAAMIGSMIGVVSSTGIGISRRVVGFEEFVWTVAGVDRVAYRLRVDVPLTTDLAATSVLKVLVNIFNVTRYDAAAENAGLVILGGSAADLSVAQNKYFFVCKDGISMTMIQTVAATAGSGVKGAVTSGDDGSLQKVVATDTVGLSGITPVAIADNATGFVYRIPPLGVM